MDTERLETAPLMGSPKVRPEGDRVIGQGPVLRRNATMGYTRQAVVGVVRSQQADLVALTEQLVTERLHMPTDPARIRVRIGRDKRYAHLCIVAPSLARNRPWQP